MAVSLLQIAATLARWLRRHRVDLDAVEITITPRDRDTAGRLSHAIQADMRPLSAFYLNVAPSSFKFAGVHFRLADAPESCSCLECKRARCLAAFQAAKRTAEADKVEADLTEKFREGSQWESPAKAGIALHYVRDIPGRIVDDVDPKARRVHCLACNRTVALDDPCSLCGLAPGAPGRGRS